MDITGSTPFFGKPVEIARLIQKQILKELGITVSIGVSFNKIFAKLGSDYNKPCGITDITRDNFKTIVWPLPVADLLMVGKATNAKLKQRYINTIGDLANAYPDNLHRLLGKHGDMLHMFANGYDSSPVSKFDSLQAVKSIGNSTTTPKDLNNNDDVKIVIYTLAESVATTEVYTHFDEGQLQAAVNSNPLAIMFS